MALGLRANAMGGSALMRGFVLNSCGVRKCIKLVSDEASVGRLDASFAFAKAKLTVTKRPIGSMNELASEIESRDVFYDATTQRIFLREITGQPMKEAYFDLKSEEFRYFTR
jgi:hypothetical protein